MTISTLADYDAAFKQSVRIVKNFSSGPDAGKWNSVASAFSNGLPSGVIPSIGNTTTGLVPVAGTTGIPSIVPFTGNGYITKIFTSVDQDTSGFYLRVMLFDRLWHAGGFAAGTTALSSQPSYVSRLPGGSYRGLQLWFESVTTTGAGTETASYTNAAGVSGRTATFVHVGDTAGGAHQYALQAGDDGIQKVDSVTFAGTGTFNIVVLRPLYVIRLDPGVADELTHGMEVLGMPQIYPTSAFGLMGYKETSNAASGPTFDMDIEIASS